MSEEVAAQLGFAVNEGGGGDADPTLQHQPPAGLIKVARVSDELTQAMAGAADQDVNGLVATVHHHATPGNGALVGRKLAKITGTVRSVVVPALQDDEEGLLHVS